MPLQERVARAVEAVRRDTPPPYLVGVSGGRDSVALLHALVKVAPGELIVCHLDHGLRPESADDALFVKKSAEDAGCVFLGGRADVAALAAERRISVETAAREARYEHFADAARTAGAQALFLAHHADDQIETLLFRLCRGSGAAGLAGMSDDSVREIDGVALRILRPLLATSREEIERYVNRHELAWREDASNADPRHTRNRIRNQLLPAIEAAYGREVRSALLRAADIARADDDYIRSHPLLQGDPAPECVVATLRAQPVAIQRRILQRWLRSEGIANVDFADIENVRALLHQESPAKVNLSGGCHARRRAGRLFLERPA
ncbi:MAG: tRNA lysidine(34) synthetase TilS [Chthoniobacteraceae bacterium]